MNLRTEIEPELWGAISKSYEAASYSNAIVDAIHYLSDVLRERANVDGDGSSLVGQALGGENPRLRINKFQTESEKNEQKGLEQIIRGIYQGVRNPRSHEQFEDTQTTANAIILFVDYILRIINQAKEPFVLDEWVKRISDPDFVKSARYAKLLIDEVPPKKYLDAIITVYRQKSPSSGEKLKYIIPTMIELLDENQLKEFLSVVSDELKMVQDDKVIKMVLQIIPAHLWEQIDEAARLRIENKLIQSIRVGEDITKNPGWLATWGQTFVQYFSLRVEAISALIEKLEGNEREQDYVARYFLSYLPAIVETATPAWYRTNLRDKLISAIVKGVSDTWVAGVLREKLLESLSSFPPEWKNSIIDGLKPLETEDSEYYKKVIEAQEADDIPF